MVVPPFSALLSDATGQMLGDLGPLLRAVVAHQVQEKPVFYLRPRSLYKVRVENLLPPVKALHIGSAFQSLSNFLPVLAVVGFDCLLELPVFIHGPVALCFGEGTLLVRSLVLGGAPLVKMRIVLLVPNQLFLSLSVINFF